MLKGKRRLFARKIIYLIPGSRKILGAYTYAQDKRNISSLGAEGVFTRKYEYMTWDCEESVSGPGSTIEYTKNIVKEIPQLINHFGVKQILDAPCGDFNWFRFVDRGRNIYYTGADIVKALVIDNQQKYEDDYTSFIHLDIINDELPEADLWLCRDCLVHLSNSDIFKVISNLLSSDIRYFLTTTHTGCKMNIDIPTGNFRRLNLELPPFNFCKPILYIDDWIEGYPVRHLALWEKHQLSESLPSKWRSIG